jgi:hypothetical protein
MEITIKGGGNWFHCMKVALYLGTKKIPHLGYIKTENLNYEIYSIVLIDFIHRRSEVRDERGVPKENKCLLGKR